MTNYAPFDGDGRFKLQPINPRPGTQPISVTNSTGRRLIDMFNQSGHSSHSASGSTLWVIEAWCKHHGYPLQVEEQRIDGELLGYYTTAL